jgi:hypothetical protein
VQKPAGPTNTPNPPIPPPKNPLLGGVLLCIFPATILFAMHLNGVPLPMPWPLFLAILFLYGLRATAVGLSLLNLESPISWLTDALAAAAFAFFAFYVAWHERTGWAGGIPFLPDSANQTLPRILFAAGGLLSTAFAARCLLKALHQLNHTPDDAMRHI